MGLKYGAIHYLTKKEGTDILDGKLFYYNTNDSIDFLIDFLNETFYTVNKLDIAEQYDIQVVEVSNELYLLISNYLLCEKEDKDFKSLEIYNHLTKMTELNIPYLKQMHILPKEFNFEVKDDYIIATIKDQAEFNNRDVVYNKTKQYVKEDKLDFEFHFEIVEERYGADKLSVKMVIKIPQKGEHTLSYVANELARIKFDFESVLN